MDVDFNLPPNHPFNPLRALRLAEALGSDLKAVQAIFRSVWVDGNLPTFVINDEVFWGDDAFEMVLDYLENPEMLADDDMQRPVGLVPTALRTR